MSATHLASKPVFLYERYALQTRVSFADSVSENEGKEKAMKAKLGVLGLGLLLLLVLPLTALAQAELAISVSTSQTCGEVAFAVDLAGGATFQRARLRSPIPIWFKANTPGR